MLAHLHVCLFAYALNRLSLSERIEQTVQLETSTVEIEEKGVRLRLTVVDTPGFGDSIDNQSW